MNIKLKILSVFLWLFVVPILSFSQESVTIHGYVTDTSGKAIVRAHIQDVQTGRVSVTDAWGKFSMPLMDSTTLKVSHVGYVTAFIHVTKNQISTAEEGDYNLIVPLLRESRILNQFEVSSDKIEHLVGHFNLIIYDYQLWDKYILMAVKSDKSYALHLYSLNMELISETKLASKPETLYQDCFGNKHVLNNDSIWQLNLEDRNINLTHAFPIQKFNDVLISCVASSDDLLFSRQYGEYNKSLTYFVVDKTTKEKKDLSIVLDKAGEHFARVEFERVDNPFVELAMYRTNQYQNPNYYPFFREPLQNPYYDPETDLWLRLIMRPIYSPLIQAKDKYYLFDHFEDRCFIYDGAGNILEEVKISYHREKNWDEQLYYDEVSDVFYTQYKVNGLIYLYELDFKSGKAVNPVRLDHHTHPEKVSVYGGYAYYLYHSPSDMRNDHLYRQKIR